MPLGTGLPAAEGSKKPEIGSTYSLPQVPGRPYGLGMPYQVRSGSITFVVATVRQALAMFDEMREDARDGLSIRDMDGRTIDPDQLRSLTEDEPGRPG
jgi:hypothetical protein